MQTARQWQMTTSSDLMVVDMQQFKTTAAKQGQDAIGVSDLSQGSS